MADTNNTIKVDIVVNTEQSKKGITTMQQDLRNLQAALEKSAKMGEVPIKVNGDKRSFEELKTMITQLKVELKSLNESYGIGLDQSYGKYLKDVEKSTKSLNEAERANELERTRAYEAKLAKEDRAFKSKQSEIDSLGSQYQRVYDRVNSYLATNTKMSERSFLAENQRLNALSERMKVLGANALQKNPLSSFGSYDDYASQFNKATKGNSDNQIALPKLETYASQIRSMTAATEDFYQKWRKAGTEVSSIDFANAKMQLRAISLEQDSFHRAIGKSTNGMYSFGQSVEYFGAKLRSHLAWLISGSVLGAAVGIPLNVVNSFKTLESAMAGVKQVLPSLEGDQSKANEQLQEFITIASRYSSAAEEVVDAGRSWGRMYKDVATVNLLVSQSAKMSIADNFSLAESVRGLESAMAQFGMKSQNINDIQMNSTHILDVWTKLSHNAGVSANDLTLAVERAGSAAHQTGVSFEFFNSLVAAGVRNTARSGAEIGGDNLAA